MTAQDPQPKEAIPKLEAFLRHLKEQRGLSEHTLKSYKASVIRVAKYLKNNGKASPIKWSTLSVRQARDYAIELQRSRSARTTQNYIIALRTFFKFLKKENVSNENPFQNIQLPKLSKPIPVFLTEQQMEALLEGPSQLLKHKALEPWEALRDRLIMELLYGGGFRVSELVNIRYKAVDWESGVLRVRGKGNKERLCPVGPVALACLKEFKNNFAKNTTGESLVLCHENGKGLSVRFIQLKLKKYLAHAKLPSNITPHKIRHSYATHLLNQRIDLRTLAELLGHSSLSTTQIYTHVSSRKLKEVHKQAHPRG